MLSGSHQLHISPASTRGCSLLSCGLASHPHRAAMDKRVSDHDSKRHLLRVARPTSLPTSIACPVVSTSSSIWPSPPPRPNLVITEIGLSNVVAMGASVLPNLPWLHIPSPHCSPLPAPTSSTQAPKPRHRHREHALGWPDPLYGPCLSGQPALLCLALCLGTKIPLAYDQSACDDLGWPSGSVKSRVIFWLHERETLCFLDNYFCVVRIIVRAPNSFWLRNWPVAWHVVPSPAWPGYAFIGPVSGCLFGHLYQNQKDQYITSWWV